MKKVIYEGNIHNVYSIKTRFGTYDIILTRQQYRSPQTLAVLALTVEDDEVVEEFAVLTVNLDCYSGMNNQNDRRAFVDSNNCPWALEFLAENGIAKPVGILQQSGFCLYPLYEWDTTKF